MSAGTKTPTRRRAVALREAKAVAMSLRAWREDRAAAAEKRRDEARKARDARGQRVRRPEPEYLVKHPDPNYAQRRRYYLHTGRRARSTANIPHVNPARDAKSLKSGRLRAELRAQLEAGDRS